jgi:hypothetical protein
MSSNYVVLPERLKQQSLDRFDPANAILTGKDTKHYEIQIPCAICKEYRKDEDCYLCPLHAFKTEKVTAGCIGWMAERIVRNFYVSQSDIWWSRACDSKVRLQLEILRDCFRKDVIWKDTEKCYYIKRWIPDTNQAASLLTKEEADESFKQLTKAYPANIYKIMRLEDK